MGNLSKYITDGFLYEFSLDNGIDFAEIYVCVFTLYHLGYFEKGDVILLVYAIKRMELFDGNYEIQSFCERFFKLLKRNFQFKNIDELLEITKQIEVEDWVVNCWRQLAYLFPNYQLYNNDIVYYINKTDPGRHLLSIKKERLENVVLQYSYYNDSNLDVPKMILENAIEIISLNQSYLYLRMKNMRDAFVCYHIPTQKKKVIYGTVVGTVNNNPIIENDKNVSILALDTLKWIGKLGDHEQVGVYENQIIIDGKFPCFCQPKFWDEKGKVIVPNDQFLRTYVLGKLKTGIFSSQNEGRVWEKISTFNVHQYKEAPGILSIDSARAYIQRDKSEESLCNTAYLTTNNVFTVLEKYFAPDEDILDPLYLMLYVNARMEQEKGFSFTQNFYELFKKLSEDNKVNVVSNSSGQVAFYSVLDKMMDYFYWTKEKIEKYEAKMNSNMVKFVGNFTVNGNKINITKVRVDKAKCYGSYRMIIPQENKDFGFVIYDMIFDQYIIQYSSDLPKESIDIIKEFFGLKEGCRVLIQS